MHIHIEFLTKDGQYEEFHLDDVALPGDDTPSRRYTFLTGDQNNPHRQYTYIVGTYSVFYRGGNVMCTAAVPTVYFKLEVEKSLDTSKLPDNIKRYTLEEYGKEFGHIADEHLRLAGDGRCKNIGFVYASTNWDNPFVGIQYGNHDLDDCAVIGLGRDGRCTFLDMLIQLCSGDQ